MADIPGCLPFLYLPGRPSHTSVCRESKHQHRLQKPLCSPLEVQHGGTDALVCEMSGTLTAAGHGRG